MAIEFANGLDLRFSISASSVTLIHIDDDSPCSNNGLVVSRSSVNLLPHGLKNACGAGQARSSPCSSTRDSSVVWAISTSTSHSSERESTRAASEHPHTRRGPPPASSRARRATRRHRRPRHDLLELRGRRWQSWRLWRQTARLRTRRQGTVPALQARWSTVIGGRGTSFCPHCQASQVSVRCAHGNRSSFASRLPTQVVAGWQGGSATLLRLSPFSPSALHQLRLGCDLRLPFKACEIGHP